MTFGSGSARTTGALAATALCLLLLTPDVRAEEGAIAGTWRGAGTVVDKKGVEQKVRCKFSVGKEKQKQHKVSGKCTSVKGTSRAKGQVKKVAAKRYSGTVNGRKADDKGEIAIVLQGGGAVLQVSGSRGELRATLKR